MAVFNCPQCQHTQAVDDKHIGKAATCPKCKTQGVVQETSSNSPSPASDSGDDPHSRVIRGAAGPLGIRCDTWMDSQRHINKASTLRLEWLTVVDHTLPVRFTKPCGLVVHNRSNDYPLLLAYHADTALEIVDETVMAFQVRYLAFNVWAEHVVTLVAEEIADLQPGKHLRWHHTWGLYSEAEGTSHWASLAFVYRALLATGTVLTANMAFVVREARRFTEKFTEADLEPKMPKRDA